MSRKQWAWILAGMIVLIGMALTLSVSVHVGFNLSPMEPSSEAFLPHSFNSQMDEELQQAWEELDEGSIAYEPKLFMRQGRPEEVRVRITRHEEVDLSAELPDEFWIERLKVSGSMAAYLEGQPGEFVISTRSSIQQALVGPYDDWLWLVTPIKSGSRSLNLRVVARISLSNGNTETKDVLVKATKIEVEVDRIWEARRFFQDNWKWLLGSPIVLGLLAWLVAGFKRIRRK